VTLASRKRSSRAAYGYTPAAETSADTETTDPIETTDITDTNDTEEIR